MPPPLVPTGPLLPALPALGWPKPNCESSASAIPIPTVVTDSTGIAMLVGRSDESSTAHSISCGGWFGRCWRCERGASDQRQHRHRDAGQQVG
eukprot:366521-Chlamydomonas_euryale.AAC.9